jgi:sodium pump decarboxylase gamma subunit
LSDFSTGLMISVVGLTVTFVALAIFIGVIVLLKKLFPFKEEKEEAEATESTPAMAESNEEEIVAAIAAVAFAKAQNTTPGSSKNPIWTSR